MKQKFCVLSSRPLHVPFHSKKSLFINRSFMFISFNLFSLQSKRTSCSDSTCLKHIEPGRVFQRAQNGKIRAWPWATGLDRGIFEMLLRISYFLDVAEQPTRGRKVKTFLFPGHSSKVPSKLDPFTSVDVKELWTEVEGSSAILCKYDTHLSPHHFDVKQEQWPVHVERDEVKEIFWILMDLCVDGVTWSHAVESSIAMFELNLKINQDDHQTTAQTLNYRPPPLNQTAGPSYVGKFIRSLML